MRNEVDDVESARRGQPAWRRWGPYLSERAWGTVREDYSADGERQLLCLAFAYWNGRDPILKERRVPGCARATSIPRRRFRMTAWWPRIVADMIIRLSNARRPA